ncbi:MAG TPA: DNA repair protein RadC [Candidatus Coprenecus avistercoris]|uniref:DNA repair protein RadC n=1 Tax=Candidatus Coprenecus avistercoris TaxID=2840730 RepID=A0A9D1E0G9_9BACT|nr:DNA repair protein RadC [Candidatus Coprenecus avistercoris]
MSINKWKMDDRPREKMNVSGAASLSDSELLAILINSGTKDKSAIDVAREILASAGNSLNALSGISMDRLCAVQGIGEAKASRLLAAFELAVRLQSEPTTPKMRITASSSVCRIFSPVLRNLQHEECWVLFLNKANKIIAKEKVSTGGVSGAVLDTRIIIRKAVDKLASAIILVHNHPSGNPYPSELDRKQTRALRDAASLLDIALLDHVIIAGDRYYSFSDEGQ